MKNAPQRYSDTEFQSQSTGKKRTPSVCPLLSTNVENIDPPPVPSHLQSALRFQNDTQSTSFGASTRPEFVTPNRPTVRLPSTAIGKTFTAAIK